MTRWHPATPADLEPIVEFLRNRRNTYEDHAYVHPRATERCVRTGKAWVATDEKGIAGVAMGNGEVLWNLVIRDDVQHTGLGSAFLAEFPHAKVRAKVSKDKRLPSPVPFYERNGYRTLGSVRSTAGKRPLVLLAKGERRVDAES